MKVDHNKYVDIEKIVRHIGIEIASYLPQLHALTGCNTTSFFYRTGKIKVLRKCIKNGTQVGILSCLGKNK